MKKLIFAVTMIVGSSLFAATELKVGDATPLFKAMTHDKQIFDLESRKNKWTILYFYPKAGTPGCTDQACSFRDSLAKIRDLGADVYGISADTADRQALFHDEHNLNFTLLSDSDATVVNLYGTKMMIGKYSKRWTFIIGPDLRIKNMMKDVDPVLDSSRVAKEIVQLQKVATKNSYI